MKVIDPLREWWVSVAGVGFIGNVWALDPERARVAALAKYGRKGMRGPVMRRPELLSIFEDDSFEVML